MKENEALTQEGVAIPRFPPPRRMPYCTHAAELKPDTLYGMSGFNSAGWVYLSTVYRYDISQSTEKSLFLLTRWSAWMLTFVKRPEIKILESSNFSVL